MFLSVLWLKVVPADNHRFAVRPVRNGLHLHKVYLTVRAVLLAYFRQRNRAFVKLWKLGFRRIPELVKIGLFVRSYRHLGGGNAEEEILCCMLINKAACFIKTRIQLLR